MKIPIGLNIEISISSCHWQEHNKDYKDIITSCCALICQNVTEGKALNKFTQIELGVVLCDDDIIHKLNNSYRKKDSATNVLSFCGFDQDEIETYLRSESVAPSRPFSLGESYISFETLNNEAKAAGIPFNEHFFKECGLVELQQKYNKKIIIKLKSRADEGGYKHNIKYLNEILPKELDYRILVDVEDDNELISKSFMVISAPSTMTFKPIQLQIPTAIIKGSGQTGLFYDFKGLVGLNKNEIVNTLEDQLINPDKTFILNTIEGGLSFNSTEVFVYQIKNLI